MSELTNIWPSSIALPAELVSVLNDTYFLHLLATDPAKIVPPGKSIVSMLSRSPFLAQSDGENQTAQESIRSQVEATVYRAFWDEASQALASSQPNVQLDRLKGLQNDLLEVLRPLFPPNHIVILSLAAPVAPTSSPVLYTFNLLKEVVLALQQRCAPARDQELNDLLGRVEFLLRSFGHTESDPSSHAERLVLTIRDIIKVSEAMKADINNFVLLHMPETQLQKVIINEAQTRERQLVLNLWKSEQGTADDRILGLWNNWVDTLDLSTIGLSGYQVHFKWVARLVQAVASSLPVRCDFPLEVPPGAVLQEKETTNILPPQLLFVCPSLLYLQNMLQALVITAALRALTRIPPNSGQASTDFIHRIWALLRLEIDDDFDEGPTAQASSTKLVNLADEVIRARRAALEEHPTLEALTTEEETRLRDAVERTLRSDDVAYSLLQKRLLSAVALALVEWSDDRFLNASSQVHSGPTEMRTGRGFIHGGQTRISPGSPIASEIVVPAVKGYEDPVLQDGIRETIRLLTSSIEWAWSCWRSQMSD